MENLHDVYRSYEPHLMSSNDSLKLFSRCAFMRDSPPKDYDILAKKVVSSARGLPLVLVTIGSLLFGKKDIAFWEEKLRKLEEIPHEKVLERLRISYDALEYTQKQIFLDIACFFIREDCINPCYMWDACGFYPRDGLNALVLRHMIKIKDGNKLRMHDHLRDLGRQIIREENMTEKGERSRLWSSEDALDLLERRMMTTKVQAFNLGLRKGLDDWDDWDGHSKHFVGDEFAQLRNLRFLKLGWAELDGDFKQHLSNLRWLEWQCPGKFWPNNCCLKNLAILDLGDSDITDDWKGWGEIKMAKELKILNLSRCNGLKRGPVLSESTTLEKLCLRGCNNLEEIDPSIWNLKNLRFLDISCSDKLRTFDCSPFSALEKLNLSYCTSLLILHFSEPLESLRYLGLSDCMRLEKLPDLSNFKKLEELHLCGWSELIEIQGLDMLECLEHLDMSYCKKLLEVDGLEGLESLEDLNMSCCMSIERLPNLSKSGKLKKLSLFNCKKLLEVDGLEGLECLEDLDMSWCSSIERLPNLSNLRMLKKLSLNHCEKLLEVDGLEGLESLEDLNMENCMSIERLLNLSNLGKLKKLSFYSCEKLIEVEGVGALKSLEFLDLGFCTSFKEVEDLSNLKNLKHLYLVGLEDLIEIWGLEELESLEELDICYCSSIEQLPDLSNHENLRLIKVDGCKKLTEIRTRPNVVSGNPLSDY